MTSVFLPNAQATHDLGRRIGEVAEASTFLALVGDLGAGKTALVRGLAQGLAVTSMVQSPTFVLLQGHRGRLPLWHVDVYRLGDASELDVLGLDELEPGVVAVEWADRFPEWLPAERLEITLTDEGRGRRVQLRSHGARHAALEDRIDVG